MISIVPYDSRWPDFFTEEQKRLYDAIGSHVAAIEHIGSTAVSQLSAKPVIDILLGVDSLDRVDVHLISALQKLGYDYIQEFEKDIPERRYFQKLTPQGKHTHHLHIVEVDGEFWQRHLLFRDYLRDHPEEARRYQDLKVQIAKQHQGDRKAYTQAKGEFVRHVESKAAGK